MKHLFDITARIVPGRSILQAFLTVVVLFAVLSIQTATAQKLSFGDKPVDFDYVQHKTQKSARLLEALEVNYSDSAAKAGMQGTSIVAVWVDEDGVAAYGEVERSSGHDVLDRAALDAVKGGNFKAAWRNNGPVGSRVTIPVEFKLAAEEEWDVKKDPGELRDNVKQLKNTRSAVENKQRKLEEEIRRLRAKQDSLKKQVKRSR